MKNYSKDEIELMSYDDIAYIILSENKKKMQIQPLFKKICTIQKLDDQIFQNHIGDFFELLSTDKRFIMLPKGFWDIRDRHIDKVVVDVDDEEELLDEEIEDTLDEEPENEEEKEDLFKDYDETEDEVDDEFSDLVVVDDEEEIDPLS